MKSAAVPRRRRRAVNLTLDPDLVAQLLREFLDGADRERLARADAVASTAEIWNEFNEKYGSIADEYSTL